VWTRHAHGIRGTLVGFLLAVDKHFNMVLPFAFYKKKFHQSLEASSSSPIFCLPCPTFGP
jgi:hypothetical protein